VGKGRVAAVPGSAVLDAAGPGAPPDCTLPHPPAAHRLPSPFHASGVEVGLQSTQAGGKGGFCCQAVQVFQKDVV